jgi:hypothetical protein
VIVWLWATGNAEGVTDDCTKAREAATSFMRMTGASAAVVEQAHFITGIRSLSAAYERAGGSHWIARRHPSGRISWSLRPTGPELAA